MTVSPSALHRIDQTSAKLQRYRLLFRSRWWFLLLCVSFGICVQAYRVSTEPIDYTSYAKLAAGGRVNVGNVPVLRDQSYSQDFFGTQIEILQSSEVRRRALDRMASLHPDLEQSRVRVTVNQARGSSILNVSATGEDPVYTQRYLDALLQEYIIFRRDMREASGSMTLNKIAEQLVRFERNLNQEEEILENFLRENSLLVINEGQNTAAQYLGGLTSERSQLQRELELLKMLDVEDDIERRQQEARAQMAGAERADDDANGRDLDAQPRGLVFGLVEAERRFLQVRQEIELMRSEREALLRTLREAHPAVLEVDEKIARSMQLLAIYRQQAMEESQRRRASIEIRLQHLEDEIARWEQEALAASAKLSQHARILASVERARDRYTSMVNTLQDVDLADNLNVDYVSIMEEASAPVSRASQFWVPISLGALVGLLIGVVVLLIFDRMDDRMNSFAEFQSHFPMLPVIGQIPLQQAKGDMQLLEPNDHRHLFAEAFRNVRSSLVFKDWGGERPKTLMITGAVPNEGKTTVVGNLAVTMALAGARVLLVDADLRRGGLNELVHLPAEPGLSDVLEGHADWRSVLQETAVKNLQFIGRGAAIDNTSELYLTARLDKMLEEFKEAYDFILFDSAPILVADDTASFAPKVDAAFIVVRMSSTPARLAAKALAALEDRQVNVGGVILNRAAANLKEYSYYNYASYYTVKPAPKVEPEVDPAEQDAPPAKA